LSLKKEGNNLINSLNKGSFYAECPCCRESFALKDTGLFYLDDFSSEAEELYNKKICELKDRRKELRERRQKISKTSKVVAKRVNIGKILERIVPCMRTFPFERNDCRSLFDPIDYIIFDGLRKSGKVERIIFTDIKTGRARLTGNQPEIKRLVENKQVFWETYKR
jgi:predicted Holliday junction resolvase-like endonuclease